MEPPREGPASADGHVVQVEEAVLAVALISNEAIVSNDSNS